MGEVVTIEHDAIGSWWIVVVDGRYFARCSFEEDAREIATLRAQHAFAERYRADFIKAFDFKGDPHWGDIATVVGAKYETIRARLAAAEGMAHTLAANVHTCCGGKGGLCFKCKASVEALAAFRAKEAGT